MTVNGKKGEHNKTKMKRTGLTYCHRSTDITWTRKVLRARGNHVEVGVRWYDRCWDNCQQRCVSLCEADLLLRADALQCYQENDKTCTWNFVLCCESFSVLEEGAIKWWRCGQMQDVWLAKMFLQLFVFVRIIFCLLVVSRAFSSRVISCLISSQLMLFQSSLLSMSNELLMSICWVLVVSVVALNIICLCVSRCLA